MIDRYIGGRVAEHDAQILSLDGPVGAKRIFRTKPSRPTIFRIRFAREKRGGEVVVLISHIDTGNGETAIAGALV